MKASQFAVAAAMALGVSAGSHYGHAHDAFHNKLNLRDYPPSNASQGCGACGAYTIWVTSYGEATRKYKEFSILAIIKTLTRLVHVPPPPATTYVAPTSPATTVTITSPVCVPTPLVTSFSSPGVYTIPATTITVTELTTVCAATTTSVPSGTNTIGGVTTVVETSTTVVCPYAYVTTSAGVTTSTILTTTYVCPSAGTYTIAPITTYVATETIIVYPIPTSYAPGTYCQPEVVTTITEIDYIVICPATSVGAPATTAVAPVAVATTPASIGTSGNQWAMTYTPYTPAGACKAASDVLTDMMAIKAAGFSTVRLYATDCNGLENVGAGCEAAGLMLIIGVFIESSGCAGAQEQVTEIIAWGKWYLVELIVIGNEAIFNGYATPSDLASFISSSKSAFRSAGYTGPCTTTEPLNILQEYTSVFCEVVDIVGCNIHPFFNGDVTAESAGSFVAQQLSIVDALCVGKSGINLETGWPSGGYCNNQACPSPENQKEAIESILSSAGGKSVIFSFTNDLWKDPGAFSCEQTWGAIYLFQ
jgi:exo-beta-1,3-glucanase (GH17 family)